ncbi:uncharacterized protein I206_102374 [Kwoniella pini CBS 10737]|uniref:Uncharacterized protein n=1 Tax=Kwoniella pini CBS 10737 TaxID=1296096 RepID=A0A1B9I585_9TREE|nr:uncharacterized protein I206_02721 [Kwoniella pini CBS 10737]OCF50666.1 hypothetical protein I206_02721 [Kwoniella pini CBS 10737]
MKTSTSFAILAVLATVGTTIAAPLPHKDHDKVSTVDMGKDHDRHDHVLDAAIKADVHMPKAGKHGHHARSDPLQTTKSLTGAIGLPTADHTKNVGLQNGHKMGKTQVNQLNPAKVLSYNTVTKSDGLNKSSKPLRGDTAKIGQQLNSPDSGAAGQVGKSVDGIMRPLEKEILSRDLLGGVTGGIDNNVNKAMNGNLNNNAPAGVVTKPLGTAAGSSGTTTGQVTKPVTGNLVDSPTVKPGLLSSKGGVTDLNNGNLGTNGGMIGSAENVVAGGTSPVFNSNSQNIPVWTVTSTVGKLPNTVNGVMNGINVDPLSNENVHVTTDSTQSDVTNTADKSLGDTITQKPIDNTVNSSAYSGEGKDHRINPHATDGTESRTETLIQDNTSNTKATMQDTTGIKSGSIDVNKNVKENTKDLNQSGLNKVENSGDKPIDQATDKIIPSSEHQKSQGSLITANNQNVDAKIVQTPGKSDKIAEKNSNSISGSKLNSDNSNVKVSLPHQAAKELPKTEKAVTVEPDHDHVKSTGKIVQQVKAVLNTNSISTPTQSNSHSPSTSATQIASSTSSASTSASGAHGHSGRPLLFIGYTNGVLNPTSTIASQSSSISPTPIADAHVHQGTIQVNKQQQSSNLNLPLTSSLNLPLPSASAKTKIDSVINKALNKPRQATVIYGQKGEHVVACDGKSHQPNDMVDECIKADLLDFKPNQTEACPTDMQHDIQSDMSTDMLNDQNEVKEIQKYVRLCLTAAAI